MPLVLRFARLLRAAADVSSSASAAEAERLLADLDEAPAVEYGGFALVLLPVAFLVPFLLLPVLFGGLMTRRLRARAGEAGWGEGQVGD